MPPLAAEDKGKKVISKGFKEITVTDFPIRGRRTLLTFRRRYWQIEGQKELLKRDMQLCFPGTQLEAEFANFLKAEFIQRQLKRTFLFGRKRTSLLGANSRSSGQFNGTKFSVSIHIEVPGMYFKSHLTL